MVTLPIQGSTFFITKINIHGYFNGFKKLSQRKI